MGVLGGPNPGSGIFVLPENTQWKITPAYEFGPEHYRYVRLVQPHLRHDALTHSRITASLSQVTPAW